jgi:hypothetical protein
MEVLSEETCLKELAKLFDANEMPLRTVESETFKKWACVCLLYQELFFM